MRTSKASTKRMWRDCVTAIWQNIWNICNGLGIFSEAVAVAEAAASRSQEAHRLLPVASIQSTRTLYWPPIARLVEWKAFCCNCPWRPKGFHDSHTNDRSVVFYPPSCVDWMHFLKAFLKKTIKLHLFTRELEWSRFCCVVLVVQKAISQKNARPSYPLI